MHAVSHLLAQELAPSDSFQNITKMEDFGGKYLKAKYSLLTKYLLLTIMTKFELCTHMQVIPYLPVADLGGFKGFNKPPMAPKMLKIHADFSSFTENEHPLNQFS